VPENWLAPIQISAKTPFPLVLCGEITGILTAENERERRLRRGGVIQR